MAYNLYRSLMQRDVIRPYVENAFKDTSKWPAKDLMQIDDPNKHDSNTDDYFHPSVHADECELGCYLRLHPVERKLLLPEVKSFKNIMTPLMGTVVHTIVQQKLLVDGRVTEDEIEVPLVDEERHWRGHADLLFMDNLIDIKTMRAEKFKYLTKPLDYWRYQLNPYMHALSKSESVVLVIEMGWPFSMKEYKIQQDADLLEEIYSKWAFVSDAIGRDVPPSHKNCERRYCAVRERFDVEAERKHKIAID